MSSFFPLFVDISKIRVVFVGGGQIAERRIQVLRQFDTKITVIAPQITEALQQLVSFGQLTWIRKEYEKGDLADLSIGMVVAATNKREVNHRVSLEAKREALPVSVVDCKEESTFYFPGIAKKDNIVAGVTSSGFDHKEAARMTQKIRRLMEEE